MIFEDREFNGDEFDDRDSGKVFSGAEFHRCYFQSYGLSIAKQPSLRSTFRNMRVIGCSQRGCTLYYVIVEDVLVDGFKTNGQLLRAHGAVFNRVVLRGKIDRLMLNNDPLPSGSKAVRDREIALWRQANAEYYKGVEWALDISQGEFKELDIRGVPGDLVRRDPETQILVKRERVLQEDWRGLDFKADITPFSLNFMLEQNMADSILIAPKRHPKFKEYLQDIKLLREAGIAEPD